MGGLKAADHSIGCAQYLLSMLISMWIHCELDVTPTLKAAGTMEGPMMVQMGDEAILPSMVRMYAPILTKQFKRIIELWIDISE